MWAAISLFFKEKVFSSTGILISIFAIIFSVFLFSNSDIILSKFGFETTSTLKSNLTKAQGDIDKLIKVNEDLSKAYDDLKKAHELKTKLLEEAQKEKLKVEIDTKKIEEKHAPIQKEIKKTIKEKVKKTSTEVTYPIEELNKLSKANVDEINETFQSLFG